MRLIAALILCLLNMGVAMAQDKTVELAPELNCLIEKSVVTFKSKSEIDPRIDILKGMVDVNENFNNSDLIIDNLPKKKLLIGGKCEGFYFVFYQQGGEASSDIVTFYTKETDHFSRIPSAFTHISSYKVMPTDRKYKNELEYIQNSIREGKIESEIKADAQVKAAPTELQCLLDNPVTLIKNKAEIDQRIDILKYIAGEGEYFNGSDVISGDKKEFHSKLITGGKCKDYTFIFYTRGGIAIYDVISFYQEKAGNLEAVSTYSINSKSSQQATIKDSKPLEYLQESVRNGSYLLTK